MRRMLKYDWFTWEQRKLGEIVERHKNMISTPTNGYRRLGVRSHAKGTFITDVPAGKQLGEKELCVVIPDALIVNIVFAWEHAVAITSQDDENALVSHRFPQFAFREDMVADFFKYAIRDEKFRHHLWLSSPSGAGRNKTLQIQEMLKYRFTLPSAAEQRQIGSFFAQLDNLITLHQRKLDALKQAKSLMLDKMFA